MLRINTLNHLVYPFAQLPLKLKLVKSKCAFVIALRFSHILHMTTSSQTMLESYKKE